MKAPSNDGRASASVTQAEPEGVVDARVSPLGSLENLSQREVQQLLSSKQSGVYELFRRCALAVLSSGLESDDVRAIFDRYKDFEIKLGRQAWGIKLEVKNAPASAFVDGSMIRGIKEHLFSVLRDIVYIHDAILGSDRFDLNDPVSITNAVYHILRNARILDYKGRPDLVVCWGGHSIGTAEYDYTKRVGYELGLRALSVCTGCGPGAMKGPMKGATIGHSKQRIREGRYIGMTEPGIIAAEPPNPIVNQLVIMPDIEKRLEAFVRCAHAIIVFPGGAGTAEEILYLLGILLDPANAGQPLPVVFTGPPSAAEYFGQIDHFIGATLGDAARSRYKIIIGDPPQAAREVYKGIESVREYRRTKSDAYNYNWLLKIPEDFQRPFEPTHEAMARLELRRDLPAHVMAANLRRAFSGIVAGNVKENGIHAIEEHGPFELHGDKEVMTLLDQLLSAFVRQKRMKIAGEYKPCYRLVA
ncbi:nucleotide 5'-monophosphate nucleosidase PpnN [Peristeroidobacter soli]|uniref:nucleotide 5'-monophosphate nucleosidase PpnN n=1 Tax=Peristeroidobacter soli TaxID=2497877 RepID=UPI00101D470E|nr:nucleotide 5'-monophosphate nucleosidase PpnN [Peristeroidobacter soli]